MIKKTQINESLLLYCIIYLCSFNFWDTKFGMFFKYFFFCVILIGLIVAKEILLFISMFFL